MDESESAKERRFRRCGDAAGGARAFIRLATRCSGDDWRLCEATDTRGSSKYEIVAYRSCHAPRSF